MKAGGERVTVYVRVRPFSSSELERGDERPIEKIDTKNNVMVGKNIFNFIFS